MCSLWIACRTSKAASNVSSSALLPHLSFAHSNPNPTIRIGIHNNLNPTGSPWWKIEDAKYSPFNTEPFKRIRMCVGSPKSNCVDHVFSREYDSARALFSAGYIRDSRVDQNGILDAFGPPSGTYQNCPMQRPGTGHTSSHVPP